MAGRGHAFGLISTYLTTWVLKTNGEGQLWISAGIPHSAVGSDKQVSVTQVCALAHCALMLFCFNVGNASPWPEHAGQELLWCLQRSLKVVIVP